jgi:2-amino-4-hydroxy-6-hydroxymethyldihydropteridine diphosphokinase
MEGKYLLLGTNMGAKSDNLQTAVDLLAAQAVRTLDSSSIYESEPWGIRDQPTFYNTIIKIDTSKTPEELLRTCLMVEQQMGRKRIIKWGERIIDIDILYFDNQMIQMDQLSIPHPGIPDRRFTLIPLNELCPDLVHPVLKISNLELLKRCQDKLGCTKINQKLRI